MGGSRIRQASRVDSRMKQEKEGSRIRPGEMVSRSRKRSWVNRIRQGVGRGYRSGSRILVLKLHCASRSSWKASKNTDYWSLCPVSGSV